jgi:transcriptional regulator
MLSQIVGFKIEIEKIEGKWKLNQNHPADRQEKVVRALQERRDENSQSVAHMMNERLTRNANDRAG